MYMTVRSYNYDINISIFSTYIAIVLPNFFHVFLRMQKSLLCLVLIASLLIAAEAAAVADANEV